MVLEVERLANRFRRAGLKAEANVLAAQANIFRAAGTPEEIDDTQAEGKLIGNSQDFEDAFPNLTYDIEDMVKVDGAKIRDLRTQLDNPLTQTGLVRKTKVGTKKPLSKGMISQIETGYRSQITRFNAVRIAYGLGVALEDILVSEAQIEQ